MEKEKLEVKVNGNICDKAVERLVDYLKENHSGSFDITVELYKPSWGTTTTFPVCEEHQSEDSAGFQKE